MSAEIINLAEARARKEALASNKPDVSDTIAAALDPQPSGKERFHFWVGATGKRYVHTIYDLLTCPTLPTSNYMLVKRDADGEVDVLAIGQLSNESASLNLAEVRRQGARLGATEVHVHLLASGPSEAAQVQSDLQAGYLTETWPADQTARVN